MALVGRWPLYSGQLKVKILWQGIVVAFVGKVAAIEVTTRAGLTVQSHLYSLIIIMIKIIIIIIIIIITYLLSRKYMTVSSYIQVQTNN